MKSRVQQTSRLVVLCVRARGWLRHYLINDAESHEVGRGQSKVLGGQRRLRGVLPENRGAAFGRDDRVGRVLQHQHTVGHADCERAARTALAYDDADDWHPELRHLEEVARDGLGLPALFGVNSGIRALRVNQGDDGASELLRELHDAQGLSVAFGLRHPEVPLASLLRASTFLLADDGHGVAVITREAADDRRVVRVTTVALEFDELLEQSFYEVERVGAFRVAS